MTLSGCYVHTRPSRGYHHRRHHRRHYRRHNRRHHRRHHHHSELLRGAEPNRALQAAAAGGPSGVGQAYFDVADLHAAERAMANRAEVMSSTAGAADKS